MELNFSVDWWLGHLYREIATFVHDPSPEGEQKIQSLIGQYRHLFEETQPTGDEHEWVMNFR